MELRNNANLSITTTEDENSIDIRWASIAQLLLFSLPPMLKKVIGWKGFTCHVGCQEVSRCHTRSKSEESIMHRWQNIQVRESTFPFKSRADITRTRIPLAPQKRLKDNFRRERKSPIDFHCDLWESSHSRLDNWLEKNEICFFF